MNQSILIMQLIAEIDKAYSKFLGNQLKGLIERNNSGLGARVGYTHNGNVYMVNKFNHPFVTTMQYKPTYVELGDLVPDLIPTHEEWEVMYDQRENTLMRIRQYLSIAIKYCESVQDVRDMLPDHVYALIKGDTPLERTRPSLEISEDGNEQKQLADTWPLKAIIAYNAVRSNIDASLGYRFFS